MSAIAVFMIIVLVVLVLAKLYLLLLVLSSIAVQYIYLHKSYIIEAVIFTILSLVLIGIDIYLIKCILL